MIGKIKRIARQMGYVIYTEPYKLNIWGFRSPSTIPNRFDDEFHVFFNTSEGLFAKWVYFVFKSTTDPGTYWLRQPMQPQGTAILAPNQYVDTYAIDKHLGKYNALCQRLKKVEVIRDYNRDAVLDFYNGNSSWMFAGINIHRANKTGDSYKVDMHSAGCQVFQKASEFSLFMRLCEMHRKLHGNKFTYTLIDRRMEKRSKLLKVVAGISILGLLGLGGLWWYSKND